MKKIIFPNNLTVNSSFYSRATFCNITLVYKAFVKHRVKHWVPLIYYTVYDQKYVDHHPYIGHPIPKPWALIWSCLFFFYLYRLCTSFWGVSVWVCGHSVNRAFVESDTHNGQEGLAHNRHTVHPKGWTQVPQGWGQGSVQATRVRPLLPSHEIHAFMDLSLSPGAQSCWNRRWPHRH